MTSQHAAPPSRRDIYSVRRHAGKPAFLCDGQLVTLPSYCACAPGWGQPWIDAHKRFVAHGRKVFWLMPTGGYNGEWGTSPFWTGPGQINDPPVAMPDDYRGLEWQARTILDMCPDARFFVRMMDMPPESWGKANPDDMLQNHLGQLYPIPSYASDRYVTEAAAFFRALAGWCERQVWAERMIGYVVYPLGEGATPLACEGFLFDQSPVMRRAFRAFLQVEYGSDRALRAAWCDDAVTIDTAAVPRDPDFRQRGDKPVLFWPEAAQVQRERDYFACQRPLFRRYYEAAIGAFKTAAPNRLVGFDAFKGNMLGWMCHPIFTGGKWKEHYGDSILATGTAGMSELLDLPGLDLVATPHDYRCRWAGFGFDPEGIGDSVQLHGKMMMVEEDQRSYANNERGLFGSIEPGEEEAVLYRNLAACLSKGQNTYPMDVCVGYFEDERIQAVFEKRLALKERFLHVARADVPSVTMLVDDRSGLYTDFSAEYNDLAVIRQRIWGLNHCGVPTRTFLWDDLERADFPACHRLFILPNCYLADERNLRLLRDKLFRNGNVIVFGPGSGITDGARVGPETAAAMLGMDMELYAYEYPRFVTIDNWAHPLTDGFAACDCFGDTHRYGPVLLPSDRTAPECTGGVKPRRAQAGDDRPFTRLGTIAIDNGKRRPGLVVKEFGRGAAGNGAPGPRGAGDYAVVFTAAVPLPAKLLRNLARFSGTHVYDDQDDVVCADSATVAVHAVRPGRRVLRLPRVCRVTDLVSGRAMARPTDRIGFTAHGPVTRWFALTPE
jgi:hypothetical protein